MSTFLDNPVSFYKMQGCGNDFVIIDNRFLHLSVEHMASWAVKICRKSFGVGADGLFFLDKAPNGSGLSYLWHFYNSDGSRAEMCGNASCCAASLAYTIGLANKHHVFGTDSCPISAEVFPSTGQVKIQLPTPHNLTKNIDISSKGGILCVHFVNIGVPHTVIFVKDITTVDVTQLGREVRFHKRFAPLGTNVNFIQVQDNTTLFLRTYERGVEEETYACGTGAAASHIIASSFGRIGPSAQFITTGGETIFINLEHDKVFLQSATKLTFRGKFYPKAIGLNGT